LRGADQFDRPILKDRSMSLPDTAGHMQDLSTGRIRRAIRTVRKTGLLPLLALVRQHGARKSFAFAANNIRHMIAHRLALHWDREHNVDTAGSIQLSSLTVVGPNRDFGNEAVCTSPQAFDFMMQSLPRDLGRYTFIDIGCGKSRTLLLASRYKFAKIAGVEFAKELVACGRRNIASFRCDRQRCRDLSVVEADAAQFEIPNAPLVLFFYNPFAQNVFDSVLRNIVASLKEQQRDCYVIYGSSSHNAIGWAKPAILATGMFEEVPAAPMPWFLDAVRSVNFAVFRTAF
jgi:SAM-dependent methyltransferase